MYLRRKVSIHPVNAALLRKDNEVIARYVAHELDHRAREAAEARAAQEALRLDPVNTRRGKHK